MVATRQRDDTEDSATSAIALLTQSQEFLLQARGKVQSNPGLSEAMIADVANFQAKALTQAERITRLLTEASIGRD